MWASRMVSEETASFFLHGGAADVGALSLSLSVLEFTSSRLREAGCFSPLTAATSVSEGLIHGCGNLCRSARVRGLPGSTSRWSRRRVI